MLRNNKLPARFFCTFFIVNSLLVVFFSLITLLGNEMKETQLYFSVKDLAVRFRVSEQTVWYWCREGRLNKPVKLGANSTRWKSIDIEQFEADRFKESA